MSKPRRSKSKNMLASLERILHRSERKDEIHPSQGIGASNPRKQLLTKSGQLMVGVDKSSQFRPNRGSRDSPDQIRGGNAFEPDNVVADEDYAEVAGYRDDIVETVVASSDLRKSARRASSAVLPTDWANPFFPSSRTTELDAKSRGMDEAIQTPHTNHKEREKEDRPPVPPKICPTKPSIASKSPPTDLLNMQGSSSNQAMAYVEGVAPPHLPSDVSETSRSGANHVRHGSAASIMDRGMLAKVSKGLGTSVMETDDISRNGSVRGTLPKGTPPNFACTIFSSEELKELEQQARTQAERFEILHPNDVQSLSQQIYMLDAQCEYLCSFSKSLRRNRRALHAQTIAYLKAPVAELPRQSILQKVETLTELDETIDKWTRQLQRAEDQRLRVRHKLLEHLAAVLSIVPTNRKADIAWCCPNTGAARDCREHHMDSQSLLE